MIIPWQRLRGSVADVTVPLLPAGHLKPILSKVTPREITDLHLIHTKYTPHSCINMCKPCGFQILQIEVSIHEQDDNLWYNKIELRGIRGRNMSIEHVFLGRVCNQTCNNRSGQVLPAISTSPSEHYPSPRHCNTTVPDKTCSRPNPQWGRWGRVKDNCHIQSVVVLWDDCTEQSMPT